MNLDITEYKKKLEELKETNINIDKAIVSKLLIMANLAELAVVTNTKISEKDIEEYFEARASVARYFCDWKLNWVSDGYKDVIHYLKKKKLI